MINETATRQPATPQTLLLFRTSIRTDADFKRACTLFDTHPHIYDWNIDREDVDCVLRIFTDQLTPGDVIALAGNLGFDCSELE